MDNNSVALVIVTFNRLDTLKKNLDYIRNQTRKPDHVLIVENGSNDGTIEFLVSQTEFDYLLVGSNIGWSGGLDEGMKYSRSNWNPDYYWLMDDDSFPSADVLKTLLTKIGEQNEPGIMGLIGCNFKNGIPIVPNASKYVREVDFVLVDNALISKPVVEKIGNLDPGFFIMAEDYEYCKRAKANGFNVWLWRDEQEMVERLHLGSQVSSRSVIWRGYYHSRNHILIIKEYPSIKEILGYIHRHGKYIIHAFLFSKDRWQILKFRFMGIWDGLRGVKGKVIDPVTLKRLTVKNRSQNVDYSRSV